MNWIFFKADQSQPRSYLSRHRTTRVVQKFIKQNQTEFPVSFGRLLINKFLVNYSVSIN